MAYYKTRTIKKNARKGLFIYLFLAAMVVLIVAAIPTREDFTRTSDQGNGQTTNNNNSDNNKSLGKRDPFQYEEENYHEWSSPTEF